MQTQDRQYLHIAYMPEGGWVLTIMARLRGSPNAQMQQAFENWAEGGLDELGIAITTRMAMLTQCIRRLNGRVAELRSEIDSDPGQLELCLSQGYAFTPKGRCTG